MKQELTLILKEANKMSFERRFELPTFEEEEYEPCVPDCEFADGACFDAGECLVKKNQ